MKRLSNIIALALCVMLTGCGLYDKYNQTVETPVDAFGPMDGGATSGGGESLAQMSWREFFTDPLLQQLIEQVLAIEDCEDGLPAVALFLAARHIV